MVRVEINARLHEEARVASAKLSLKPTGGLAALRDQIGEQLRISVRWAEEQDAMIGHIKAYLQWGGEEALMLSTTGGAVEVKGSPLPEAEQAPETAEVGITAIVFGIELETVEDRLEGMAAAIAGQNGEWCTYVHECEHHHHHDHDHEHGEDCGCHDHDHEHHHEHDHDHEHRHDHHHDHDHGHEQGEA